jgi:hypothetical protein
MARSERVLLDRNVPVADDAPRIKSVATGQRVGVEILDRWQKKPIAMSEP